MYIICVHCVCHKYINQLYANYVLGSREGLQLRGMFISEIKFMYHTSISTAYKQNSAFDFTLLLFRRKWQPLAVYRPNKEHAPSSLHKPAPFCLWQRQQVKIALCKTDVLRTRETWVLHVATSWKTSWTWPNQKTWAVQYSLEILIQTWLH